MRYVLVLAFACLWSARASATVVVVLPLDTMVAEADAVVLGTVREVRVVPAVSGDPFTVHVLSVEEWVKGDGPRRIAIRELGGTVGDRGVFVPGVPRYREGDRHLVFLRRSGEDTYTTLGLAQGAYRIDQAGRATRALDELTFVAPRADAMRPVHVVETPVELTDLLARVRSLLP